MKLSSSIYLLTITFLGSYQSYFTPVSCFAPPALLARTKARQNGVSVSAPTFSSRLYMSTLEDTKELSSTKSSLVPPAIGSPEHEQAPLSFGADQVQRKEKISEASTVEFLVLGTWMAALSAFLLINNYVGPWPQAIESVPVRYYGLTHSLSAMLFGGGVILTTLIEWLVVSSKNPTVLNFWFGKVPDLDSKIVLPALTGAIVSGVGLSVDHYDSLGEAPTHIVAAISALLAFAGWWATTDLTTQGAASEAINEWTLGDARNTDVPRIAKLRRISNVVSCAFVAAIYAIMVLKPGYHP